MLHRISIKHLDLFDLLLRRTLDQLDTPSFGFYLKHSPCIGVVRNVGNREHRNDMSLRVAHCVLRQRHHIRAELIHRNRSCRRIVFGLNCNDPATSFQQDINVRIGCLNTIVEGFADVFHCESVLRGSVGNSQLI